MKHWIPNQHGAWAFVITPVVIGGLRAGWTLWHWLLLLGWISAYCFNFYIGLTVKGWRREDRFSRYRSQQLTYGAIAAVSATALCIQRPQLLIAGLALLPVFAANLYFISSRNERAWLNDLLGVIAASWLGGISLWFGSENFEVTNLTWLLWTGCYFAGTVWYVKTMIRERGKSGWLWLSRLWHTGLVVVVAIADPAFLAVFIPAGVRAWWLPGHKISAKHVGFIEVGITLILVGVSLLTHR